MVNKIWREVDQDNKIEQVIDAVHLNEAPDFHLYLLVIFCTILCNIHQFHSFTFSRFHYNIGENHGLRSKEQLENLLEEVDTTLLTYRKLSIEELQTLNLTGAYS